MRLIKMAHHVAHFGLLCKLNYHNLGYRNYDRRLAQVDQSFYIKAKTSQLQIQQLRCIRGAICTLDFGENPRLLGAIFAGPNRHSAIPDRMAIDRARVVASRALNALVIK